MDIEYELVTLNSKLVELGEQCGKINEIANDYNSSSLKKLSGTELSGLSSKLTSGIERLTKSYSNCNDWFSRLNNELKTLEETLKEMKNEDGTLPEDFKESFSDLFTKIAVPVLTTKYRKEQKEKNSITYKKKQFLGNGVDDLSQYSVASNVRNMRKHMRMFDNTTGEEIPEDGHLTLKVGETRVITVKLPTNTGAINQIVRTTAADTSSKTGIVDTYKITSSKSNLTNDPNNIEYVNYKSNHWPSDKSLLHNNYYEWIIHADKVGARQISQTCEYSNSAIPGWYAKAMIGLNIKIVD